MNIIFSVPAPYSTTSKVEVYEVNDNACYEWRIIDGGRIVQDTGTEGTVYVRGRQYGNSVIALRDALMVSSGLEDAYLSRSEAE